MIVSCALTIHNLTHMNTFTLFALTMLAITPVIRAVADDAPVPDPLPIRYTLSDCHLHLVDFLQRTDGIKVVLEAMNRRAWSTP